METGLIIAQVAFLVLLYLFVWAVVRMSGKQLRDREPDRSVEVAPPSPIVGPPEEPVAVGAVASPYEADAADDPFAGHVAAPPPAEPAFPVEDEPPFRDEPLPPFPEADVPADLPDAPAAPVEPVPAPAADEPDRSRRRRGDTGVLDLAEHLDPKLIVESSAAIAPDTVIPLAGGLTIGRSGSNDVCIEDPFVSHIHARILRRGPYYFVEDLGSTNGTFLNDMRVDGDARLKVRDTLRLGETVLRYEE